MPLTLYAWAKDRGQRNPPPGTVIRPDNLAKGLFRFLFVMDQVEFVLEAELASVEAAPTAELMLRGEANFPLTVGLPIVLVEEMAPRPPETQSKFFAEASGLIPQQPHAKLPYAALIGAKQLAQPTPGGGHPTCEELRGHLGDWYLSVAWGKQYQANWHDHLTVLNQHPIDRWRGPWCP